MQKKIIALAIASAMTVPAMAYAEASISGQINMSIDRKTDGNATSTSANQLNSNQSRVIIKGSEDLGGGLSAMYQLDNRFNADTGTAAQMWDGNTFVGLKGEGWGSVMAGNIDTPYKSSTRKLDVFFDVAGDNRAGLGGLIGSAGLSGNLASHDSRLSNVLAYNSPSMSGFSVSAATVFGSETLPQPTAPANTTKGTVLSLAGMYSADNIYATVAYDSIKYGAPGTGILGTTVDDENKAFKLGGGYTMAAFTLNAFVEMPSYKVKTSGAETKRTDVYFGGKFALSSTDAVKLAYTMRGESKTGATNHADKASQVAIGYDHNMSKATSVYAAYVKTSANGTLADPSTLSFGLKHAF